jgi:hypothetical protein
LIDPAFDERARHDLRTPDLNFPRATLSRDRVSTPAPQNRPMDEAWL